MIGAIHDLAGHLTATGCALLEAAEQLSEDCDITRAEQEIHAMTQCLSLLETAAVCLEAGNADHAQRIMDYVLVHKQRVLAADDVARPWKVDHAVNGHAVVTPVGNGSGGRSEPHDLAKADSHEFGSPQSMKTGSGRRRSGRPPGFSEESLPEIRPESSGRRRSGRPPGF